MGKKTHYLKERDKEIIEFLQKTNLYITAEQAGRFIYLTESKNLKSSLTIAQRRLGILHDLKYLNRYRRGVGESYVYYVGKKEKIKTPEHKLLITEFIIRLRENFEIVDIDTEYQGLLEIYGIIPDIFAIIKFNKFHFTLLIECDRHPKKFSELNKKTNIKKGDCYLKVLEDRKNKKVEILPHFPIVISCSNSKLDVKHPQIISIKEDLKDFSNLANKINVLIDLANNYKKNNK